MTEHKDIEEGKGVTDDCINCGKEIVSTGIYYFGQGSGNYYDGTAKIIHVPMYVWVHADTREPKCVGIKDRGAASSKRPPQ